MKKTLITLSMISVFALHGYAQTDYSDYLNKAMEKVEAGDCDAAQRFYNVYKELTGNTSSWVEKAIKDCVDKSKPKTYNIGDDAEDFIGYSGFKIAYLDASGKHGFAIKFRDSRNSGFAAELSINELKRLYPYRYSLGLVGEYWSSTEIEGTGNAFHHPYVYTFDFSTGEIKKRRITGESGVYKHLTVKRF